MEDIDGGLHPAVDGQSLDEMRCVIMFENIMCHWRGRANNLKRCLGEIFAYVIVFLNPSIEVVTFHLRGWQPPRWPSG